MRPGFSVKKIKTEDRRSSIESDLSPDDGHGDGPTSPISPVEGKRVVFKEEKSGGPKGEKGVEESHGKRGNGIFTGNSSSSHNSKVKDIKRNVKKERVCWISFVPMLFCV